MTRIIGGRFGGRRLATPRGAATRPTSDRVREALFSALVARDLIDGCVVLDLYAGSGALGLEAASRGASRVDLVEKDRATARVISTNADTLGARVHVHASAVSAFARSGSGPAADLVLADPPYPMGEDDLAADLAGLVEGGRLAAGAVLVVERSTRSPEPTWPPGVSGEGRRTYGETALWFAHADDEPAVVDAEEAQSDKKVQAADPGQAGPGLLGSPT